MTDLEKLNREIIQNGDVDAIKELIVQSRREGTLDEALLTVNACLEEQTRKVASIDHIQRSLAIEILEGAAWSRQAAAPATEEKVLFTVRMYDRHENRWFDILGRVSREEAEARWQRETQGGTQNIQYNEGLYYEIFPAKTKMLRGLDNG